MRQIRHHALDYNKQSLRGVGANAFGELFGLGGAFALGALILTRLGDQGGVGMALLAFAIAVASGVIEATVVGWRSIGPCGPGSRRSGGAPGGWARWAGRWRPTCWDTCPPR